MNLDPLLFTSVLDIFIVAVAVAGITLCVRFARAPAFQSARLEFLAIIGGLSIWAIYYGTDLLVIFFASLMFEEAAALQISSFIHNQLRFFTDVGAILLLAFGFLRLLSRVAELHADLSRSESELREEIGSRDRAEEELLATAKAQREDSRLKSEFLVTISHELRTPLNGILGLASLLSNTGLADDQRRLLTTLEQSAKAMLNRVSDVLDLAKLESGQRDLRTVSFNPAELATNVEALYLPFANEKELAVSAQADGAADRNVIGDQALARQALSNIVSNAIKYTPAGKVDIQTRLTPCDAERLWLEFEVVDTGVGVDPGIAERISQAEAKVNQGDVGLGLAISWHIAQLMDGHLQLEPLDGGTRACLRLQVQREPEVAEIVGEEV